jgi:hypothetical protein
MEHITEIVVSLRGVGSEVHNLLAVAQCLLRLSLLQEHQPKVAASLGRCRVESDGFAEVLERGGLVSHESEDVAKVIVGLGETGIKPEGVAEVADRGVEVSLVHERRSKVAEDRGVIGSEPQRRLTTDDGAIKLSECPVGLGEAGMIGRLGGSDGDRAADQLGGSPGIPPLECHQAQEMKGIGSVRVLLQGHLVDTSGPIKLAQPVALQGLAQVCAHILIYKILVISASHRFTLHSCCNDRSSASRSIRATLVDRSLIA